MILCENAAFVFLVKAQLARMHKSLFNKSYLGKCWELMAMFHLLKIRTSFCLFRNDKCNLLLALSIYLRYLSSYDFEEHRSGLC